MEGTFMKKFTSYYTRILLGYNTQTVMDLLNAIRNNEFLVETKNDPSSLEKQIHFMKTLRAKTKTSDKSKN